MEFKVEKLPRYRFAYVRQVGPYGPGNIQAMERMKRWGAERNLLNHSAILLGIPWDNPETTPPKNCRYDACLVISQDEPLDDDTVHIGEISGGDYLVCAIKHTAQAMQQAWAELMPTLQAKGYQIDDRPILERYTGEMLLKEFCEICVPITSLN